MGERRDPWRLRLGAPPPAACTAGVAAALAAHTARCGPAERNPDAGPQLNPQPDHAPPLPPPHSTLCGHGSLRAARAALAPLSRALSDGLPQLRELALPLAGLLELGALAWAEAMAMGVGLPAGEGAMALRAALAGRYQGAYSALQHAPHAVLLLPGWLVPPGAPPAAAAQRGLRGGCQRPSEAPFSGPRYGAHCWPQVLKHGCLLATSHPPLPNTRRTRTDRDEPKRRQRGVAR